MDRSGPHAPPESGFIRWVEARIFVVDGGDTKSDRAPDQHAAITRYESVAVSCSSLTPFGRLIARLTDASSQSRADYGLRTRNRVTIDDEPRVE